MVNLEDEGLVRQRELHHMRPAADFPGLEGGLRFGVETDLPRRPDFLGGGREVGRRAGYEYALRRQAC